MADAAAAGPPSTRDLLESALRGDAAAQHALFERQRAVLVGRARRHRLLRYVKQHLTPEDVAQEVLLRALATGFLGRFLERGPGSLGAALARLLDNVMLDACRRYAAKKRTPGDASASRTDKLSRDPTPTSNARRNDLLAFCRQRLEPHEWDVWRLSEIDGLSVPAIAERLGHTPASVRGVLFRARARLVRHFGDGAAAEA